MARRRGRVQTSRWMFWRSAAISRRYRNLTELSRVELASGMEFILLNCLNRAAFLKVTRSSILQHVQCNVHVSCVMNCWSFIIFSPWNGFFYDSVGAGSRWSLCVPMDFKTHTGWMTQWLRRFPKPDSLWSVTHIISNQLERIDPVPAGVAPLTIHVRIDPVTWINALNGHICYGKHRSVQSACITPSCWVLLRVCSRQHDPRQTYFVLCREQRKRQQRFWSLSLFKVL